MSQKRTKAHSSKSSKSIEPEPDIELESIEDDTNVDETEFQEEGNDRLLKSLNSIGALKFETIPLGELPLNKKFNIQRLFLIDTSFGKRLVCELGNFESENQLGEDISEFSGKNVFLPERFKTLTEYEIHQIVARKYKLISKGLQKMANGKVARIIEFCY